MVADFGFDAGLGGAPPAPIRTSRTLETSPATQHSSRFNSSDSRTIRTSCETLKALGLRVPNSSSP
jgi:hypothetical protein